MPVRQRPNACFHGQYFSFAAGISYRQEMQNAGKPVPDREVMVTGRISPRRRNSGERVDRGVCKLSRLSGLGLSFLRVQPRLEQRDSHPQNFYVAPPPELAGDLQTATRLSSLPNHCLTHASAPPWDQPWLPAEEVVEIGNRHVNLVFRKQKAMLIVAAHSQASGPAAFRQPPVSADGRS